MSAAGIVIVGAGLAGGYWLAYGGSGPWSDVASPTPFWAASAAALAVTALLFVAMLWRAISPAGRNPASGWPGSDDEVVILVGHQPEIGMVANLLLHGRAENCSFKKGTIWWLQQQVHAGQCRCELRAMVTPDTI